MLSPDDQRLVDLDPELPGLRPLLDDADDTITRAIARTWPTLDVSRVRANYVRYKPRTSCIVGYEFTTGAGPRFGYARAHRAGFSEKLRVERDEAVALDDLGCILFRPGYDADLPGLRRLMAADDEGLFEKLTGRRHAERVIRPLAYKPERRWVGQV